MQRKTYLNLFLTLCLSIILLTNFTTPAWAMGGEQPPLNEPAPEFTLPTNTGDGTVSLNDYQGQWVVLYFYPRATRLV